MKVLPGRKNEVLVTSDYSLFTYKRERFYQIRIDKISENMREKNLSKDFPILVDEEFSILDGAYRFEANKLIGSPIYYKVVEIANRLDVLKATSLVNKPTDYEFILFHKDKLAYRKILEWEKILPFDYKEIVRFLDYGYLSRKNSLYKKFVNGDMEYTKQKDFSLRKISLLNELIHNEFGYFELSIEWLNTRLECAEYKEDKAFKAILSFPQIDKFIELYKDGHPLLPAFTDIWDEWETMNYRFETVSAINPYSLHSEKPIPAYPNLSSFYIIADIEVPAAN